MGVDFRASLYALSDVIINRPPPLRLFDQIYMKLPDMLLQSELIGRWCKGKRVVFVGDGDAIALALVHLGHKELLPDVPEHATVLDFDERVVNSVNQFASRHGLTSLIHAERYNVADPLPEKHWQQHDAFYTNPPWGASNDGESVCAFIERGIEATKSDALGCVVIGDHSERQWTHGVQLRTQRLLLDHSFRVAEMVPRFHKYHLDDDPDITSCCLIGERRGGAAKPYASRPLAVERLHNFYGAENPLRIHYIIDRRNGGKLASRDIATVPFEGSSGARVQAAE